MNVKHTTKLKKWFNSLNFYCSTEMRKFYQFCQFLANGFKNTMEENFFFFTRNLCEKIMMYFTTFKKEQGAFSKFKRQGAALFKIA